MENLKNKIVLVQDTFQYIGSGESEGDSIVGQVTDSKVNDYMLEFNTMSKVNPELIDGYKIRMTSEDGILYTGNLSREESKSTGTISGILYRNKKGIFITGTWNEEEPDEEYSPLTWFARIDLN